MDAYKVYYSTGGKTASMIVLVESGDDIQHAIFNKDKDFRIDSRWSNVINEEKIPLSNVLVSDLSVTELLMLLKDK